MPWLLLASALIAAATAFWPDLTASLVFPVALFVPLLLLARRGMLQSEARYLVNVAILAFALRLACAYLVEGLALIDKHDALKYHVIGTILKQYLQAGRFQEVYSWAAATSHPGYYFLVSLVYSIFGENLLLAQNLNAMVSALTVVPIYLLAREMSPDIRVARLAALAFAWFPNSIFWSTQLLKDSLIVLLEVLLAVDLVRVMRGDSRGSTITRLLIITVALGELRFYLPVLIYASCGLAFVLFWRPRPEARRTVSLVAVACGIGLIALAWFVTGGSWTRYFQSQNWSGIHEFRSSTMGGDSDFGRDADLRSPSGLAAFLPVGAVYFLAGPLPWEVSKFTQYLTWLDIPIWYPALLFGFAGLWTLARLRHAVPLVSICLGLTIFYSVFLANLGTAYRMRLQVIPFFLVAAACYWHRGRDGVQFAPTHSAHLL